MIYLSIYLSIMIYQMVPFSTNDA